MKQSLFFSKYRFAYLLFAFSFVLFTSCGNEDEDSSNINRISMKTLPKLNYILGNPLDLSNMVITLDKGGNMVDVPFSSFATEDITTEPQNGQLLELSNKSIIVKLGTTGAGLTQTINVTNNVVDVAIKTPPTAVFFSGQRLDLSDMVLTLTYENNDTRDFTFAEFEDTNIITSPTNGAVLASANTEVVITHEPTNVSTIQAIKINSFIPRSGAIVSLPTKTTYTVGEPLDLKGTIILYTMFNQTTVEIPFEDFENFRITSNPANRTILQASNTQVRVAHPFGAAVNIPITVN
tara:strand:- start:80 stop:958 length:879 start_codon:yes stop_codon:yes gene_type:complete